MSVVFLPRKEFDIHKCRVLACLAFAIRAQDSYPATSYWALQVCGLQEIPGDISRVAAMLKKPDYSLVHRQTRMLVYTELLDPLVSGLRYILEPTRTSASKAEHKRITLAINYIAPVVERVLAPYAEEFKRFADYLSVNVREHRETGGDDNQADRAGSSDHRRPEPIQVW